MFMLYKSLHFPSPIVSLHSADVVVVATRGIRIVWELGLTMTAWGQSIGISIGMLPQTLIMSRLGARI